jgi:hypothetical protein
MRNHIGIVTERDFKASCLGTDSDIKVDEQVVGVIRSLHALDGNTRILKLWRQVRDSRAMDHQLQFRVFKTLPPERWFEAVYAVFVSLTCA